MDGRRDGAKAFLSNDRENDPFFDRSLRRKGTRAISAACNCPYVFTVLSPRLHLSLSLLNCAIYRGTYLRIRFACSSIVDLRTRPGRTAKDKPLESVPSSRESGPRSRVVRELFVWRFEAGGIVGRERRSSISRRSVRRSSILLRANFREFGFLL